MCKDPNKSASSNTSKELSPYEEMCLIGKLSKEIEEELINTEWSKPYSDVKELFSDLGLYD